MFAGIAAIGLINEALDEGDPMKTLGMLQNPSAKLTDVDPSVAQHYHDKLLEARREKAHVRQTHRNRLYLPGSGCIKDKIQKIDVQVMIYRRIQGLDGNSVQPGYCVCILVSLLSLGDLLFLCVSSIQVSIM